MLVIFKHRFYIFVFILFLLYSHLTVKAQDPSFTQSFATSIYTNPAFAGSKNGLRMSIINRLQWVSAVSKLSTSSLAADMAYRKFGFGFVNTYERNGPAFRNLYTAASASYRLGNVRRILIQPGFQLSYMHKGLNWSDLFFYDQLSPTNGLSNPVSGAVQPYQNINSLNFSAGFVTQIPLEIHKPMPGWFNFGFVTHYLRETYLSYVEPDNDDLFPKKYVVHTGVLFPLFIRNKQTGLYKQTPFIIYPNIKAEFQGKFSTIDLSLMAYRKPVFAGFTIKTFKKFHDIQSVNQMAFIFGYEGLYKKFTAYQVSYSIDWSYTGVNEPKTSVFLTHEMSVKLIIASKRKTDCIPDLNFDENAWYNPDNLQIRKAGDCPPGKTKYRKNLDYLPVFYPFEIPVTTNEQMQ